MDTPSVVPTGPEKEVARAWIVALQQASALRAAQRYDYQLLTGPRIRTAMAELCPLLAVRGGIDNPVALRALAAGVTLIQPTALLLMLAGMARAPGRRARAAAHAAQMEAWLRRQLGTLEGPR